MNSPGLVRSFINSISIVIIDEYFLEISHVMPGKPAATAGLRSGDRLITVNEVMVIFLPISDVMMALNMDQLMAYVEFERWAKRVSTLFKKTLFHQAHIQGRVSDKRAGQERHQNKGGQYYKRFDQ